MPVVLPGRSSILFIRGARVREEQARQQLEARIEAGGKLVVAQEADWATVKRLQARCLEADLPATLGACPKGG